MKQHRECMKNLATTQCNCRIHQCIKLIINLNSTQFNHLINLLNLFKSPYKICDQHNYPFEFYSKNDIKCKFCLHKSNEIQLIQNMTTKEITSNIQQFPINQIQKNIENRKNEIQQLVPLNMRIDLQENEEIKNKLKEREKLKETIEFVRLTGPTEVHNEFHEAIEKIDSQIHIGEDSYQYDVLKLRDFLLQLQ